MRIVCIGNSHLGALAQGAAAGRAAGETRSFDLLAGRLGHPEFNPVVEPGKRLNPALESAVAAALHGQESERIRRLIPGTTPEGRTVLVSMIGGNAHNLLGLLEPRPPFDLVLSGQPELPLAEVDVLPEAQVAAVLAAAVEAEIAPIFAALRLAFVEETWHLESPPPILSNDHIATHVEQRFQAGAGRPVAPPALRYKLWRLHGAAVAVLCRRHGIRFVPHPAAAVDARGFLLPELTPENATHAGAGYGRLLLDQFEELLDAPPAATGDNPYRHQPPAAFWSQAVALPDPEEVKPLRRFGFRIRRTDKVATAGSCFAQHIAAHLSRSGFDYYVAEKPHPILARAIARDFNYGVFSARYANIYTSRQLLQLLQRAEGSFVPIEDCWVAADGKEVLDPFRPTIQPVPFASVEEMHRDRETHLTAVRRMIREMDVFVFTLGLTETWADARDGAVFPVCPGVAGGRFDPATHRFLNLGAADVVADLRAALAILLEARPALKVVLTVSPVPLKATASDMHVLSATTYSKSVLRVAAAEICREFRNVAYFPSYEIITGNYARGRYYADDLREVLPEGVEHVMRTFLEFATERGAAAPAGAEAEGSGKETVPAVARLECEEELLAFDRIVDRKTGS